MNIFKCVHLVFFVSTTISCKAQDTQVRPHPSDISVRSGANEDEAFSINYLMGKFDPASHPDFMVIPVKYRDDEIRYIRKDVMTAFIAMYDAAAKDGINFKIRSATRNFENQKRIWENKWTGKTILEDNVNAALDISSDVLRAKKILEYSSMPGTSRHHWGTDIDINSFDNDWFAKGEGGKLYQWMLAHAHEYGFCQPYSAMNSDRNTGYFEERWHWTYTPVSGALTRMAEQMLTDDMIADFQGATTAKDIGIVQNYILGISPACKTSK